MRLIYRPHFLASFRASEAILISGLMPDEAQTTPHTARPVEQPTGNGRFARPKDDARLSCRRHSADMIERRAAS